MNDTENFNKPFCECIKGADKETVKALIEKLADAAKAVIITKSVYEIVTNIDCDCPISIKTVLPDDNGQCIHITYTGWMNLKTIEAIGKYFGDNNPAIVTEDLEGLERLEGAEKCVTKIIIINEKRKELIGYKYEKSIQSKRSSRK